MIFKRLVIFMTIVFIIIAAGSYYIYNISESAGISKSMTAISLLSFIGISTLVSLFLGRGIPKEGGNVDFEIHSTGDKKAGKSYAWLIPQTHKTPSGFPITRKLMIIGRATNIDITINDPTISKKHAQLISFENEYQLRDLDSRNGTFINNQRISEAYLGNGDLITFGEAKFVFLFPREKTGLPEEESELTPAALKFDLDITPDDLESGILTSTTTKSQKGSRLRKLSDSKTGGTDKEMNKQKNDKTFFAGNKSADTGKMNPVDSNTQIPKPNQGVKGTNKNTNTKNQN
jgi:pSer/pThr/pTyr-binding forkhead associated (FHA) protein